MLSLSSNWKCVKSNSNKKPVPADLNVIGEEVDIKNSSSNIFIGTNFPTICISHFVQYLFLTPV